MPVGTFQNILAEEHEICVPSKTVTSRVNDLADA